MKNIFLLLAFLPLLVFGQKTTITKETQKEVSVNVNQDDDGRRDVKITTVTDGKKKVITWKDNGKIPANIKEQLDQEGIDINLIDDSQKEISEDVEIHIDRKAMTSPKKIMIKTIDNGDESVIEWNGDGQMPSEMQELLEEHDLDIESMGDDSQVRSTKMKKRIKERKMKHEYAKEKGRKMNQKEIKKLKTVTIDEEGNTEVLEWEDDGEKPNKEKLHPSHKLKGAHRMVFIDDENDEENIFVIDSKQKQRLSNAYMGAHISTSVKGALIEEVQKDSPAAEAKLMKGDIVKRINGARVKTMEDLLDLLSFYEPKDEIKLLINRNGSDKEIKLSLGERPKEFRL